MNLKQIARLEHMIEELENAHEDIENMAYFLNLPDNYDMKLLKIRDSINDLIREARERHAYETEHVNMEDINPLIDNF